jgi:dTDP-4-dehydrorhamnose reductase
MNILKTHRVRILITGSNGLLGQKLVERCKKHQINFLATSKGENRNSDCDPNDYQEMDITSADEIAYVFTNFKPTHVIHTAAITNVDYCELHPEECKKVNTDAVQLLFEASKKMNSHFQLLSTDFVFDGEKGNYNENDKVNPLSHYAQRKVDAENLLLNDGDYNNWSIVRTIIVYGTGNNLSRSNLISWTISALKKNEQLKVVDDQFRAPTWASDLAYACIEICSRNKKGIYHISGPETFSILEIAQKVADFFNLPKENIQKISSSELNQPAKRPPITGFDLTKATEELNYHPKTIIETLQLL